MLAALTLIFFFLFCFAKDKGKGKESEPENVEMDDGGVCFSFDINYTANDALTSISNTIRPSPLWLFIDIRKLCN